MNRVTIEHLINAGFLLCGTGHKILVDAVYTQCSPPFSSMPDTLLKPIERAEGPFEEVDLYLFTHRHPDHCDAAELRMLQNRGAQIILPADVYASNAELPVQRMTVVAASGIVCDDKTLRITAIETVHDHRGDVQLPLHFSYLLEFKPENVRVLIMGDAATEPGLFADWIEGKQLSALTINFVEMNQPKGRAFLRELAPACTLLCHLPMPADDTYHMGKLALQGLEKYRPELPPCIMCYDLHGQRTLQPVEVRA